MTYFLKEYLHFQLLPLYAALGLGVTAAILYPLRCALKSPDVTWNSKKNPEPWNEYTDKQYKVFSSKP